MGVLVAGAVKVEEGVDRPLAVDERQDLLRESINL